ncbi:MAG: hypothetical protein E7612_04720 [Ruminococcaceae bacterium]|nr:hypothetical protein [Oscillospiraceae bacterium]
MKNPKAIFLALLIPILLLSLFSCLGAADFGGEDITSVLLSKSSLTFTGLGESAELTATVVKNGINVTSSADVGEIVWSSSDTGVATVENGLVTVVGYGSCVIRAALDNCSSFCTVSNPNVNQPFSLSQDEIVLENIGRSISISAISDTGEDISSKVSWRSSNDNIATCDDGVVTAVGYGSCTLTAVYNRKSITCIVMVSNPIMPTITLSESRLNLEVGENYTLTTATDNNAGNITSWKSTDEEIAACADGVVTANKKGICAVVVMTEFGYTDVCIVTVGQSPNKISHSNLLRFDMQDIGKELLSIDKTTGVLISCATVIDYNVKTLLLSDGRLVVEISLVCVKTYDQDGLEGTNPATVTTTLYRENDVFCDKKMYRTENVKVGEVFTVKCSGFTVQTNTDKTARELYMTFATITER